MILINQTGRERTLTDTTTGERGRQIQLLNKTGANSVRGSVVAMDTTTAQAVKLVGADVPNPVGVIYESGIADGSLVWVWVNGSLAKVLLQDSTAATVGYWAKVSDTVAGRADITNLLPPGGTIQALEDHGSELGHGGETVSAGTNVLALVNLHFN